MMVVMIMVNIKYCGHSYGKRIASNDSCKFGRSIVTVELIHWYTVIMVNDGCIMNNNRKDGGLNHD